MWPAWQDTAATIGWLAERGPDERSGDVWARLEDPADAG